MAAIVTKRIWLTNFATFQVFPPVPIWLLSARTYITFASIDGALSQAFPYFPFVQDTVAAALLLWI